MEEQATLECEFPFSDVLLTKLIITYEFNMSSYTLYIICLLIAGNHIKKGNKSKLNLQIWILLTQSKSITIITRSMLTISLVVFTDMF